MPPLELKAPLSGWCAPLAEVPDPVFAGGMMGMGLAIDPVDALLCAPCDGTVSALPGSAHAVTIRADHGAEILLHIGIDTVALGGRGFEALVRAGARVRGGEPLIRFDLERLAREAKSLVTPVVVTEPERFDIELRPAARRLRLGDPLMSLRPRAASAAVAAGTPAPAARLGEFAVRLPHGLHARPAALIAGSLRPLQGEYTLALRGRQANARSAVAIMALGAGAGDRVEVSGTGIDAAGVLEAIEAALARAAAIGGEPARPASAAPRAAAATTDGTFTGVRASPGIAIGPAWRLRRSEPRVAETAGKPAQELAALDQARERLRRRLARSQGAGSGTAGDILGAHLEFLDDPELLASAHAGIAAGQSAGLAWKNAVRQAIGALAAVGDAHLAARVDDLRDLEWQLLELLGGAVPAGVAAPPARAILVARDLLPSQLLALEAGRLGGICTVSAAATSHVAILAQSRGLPMLAGVDAGLLEIADGTPLLLDADAGTVTPAPDARAAAEAEARVAAQRERGARLRAAAREPGRTADGARIEVYANVASPEEAAAAVESGAEGCGLLRTEFLFLDRADAPGREEQASRYQSIVDAFGGRPVVIRTLDAGGDKAMPFLPMPPEDNPALGLRGIRAGLWRPGILRTQLAAILAVQPPGRCRILLPMVNEPGEIAAVRRLLAELPGGAQATLGVMIETPAAAVDADLLARAADFLSIGTNDLSQYVLATDRTHPLLAAKLDALHPAVLRLIGRVCEAAQAAGRPVSVCGGLASEPAAAPLLAGLGAGALSATPAAVPAVKDALCRATRAECRALAARALALESAAAVREALAS